MIRNDLKTPANTRLPDACRRQESVREPRKTGSPWLISAGVFLAACSSHSAWSKTADLSADLRELSLEQLGAIEVTSVSKKGQRLADAPAAIYVITGDAIRRSGANSLPEALRLAPNLQVARIRSSQYAISARGFNSSTANKLLVMIDGRSVYTPLFSGVFWDVQDVLLEDVDRIEVISGPGGALWGDNAVNGVINIITKGTSDTVGTFAQVVGGNQERGAAFRQGGTLGNGGSYRVYGKLDSFDETIRANGTAVPDDWRRRQIGFRTDWAGDDDSKVTVQGNTYQNSVDQLTFGRQRSNGANLLGRWEKTLADGASLSLQSYYDHTGRNVPGSFAETLDTVDITLQHTLPASDRSQFIWGAGYRLSADRVSNTSVGTLAFLPAHRTLQSANLFAQQEYKLLSDVQLTVGAKLEYNDYSKLDFLPNVRVAWKPLDDHLLWGALSRAVRAPSRIDADLYAPARAPFLLAGGPNFRSETADTAEIGYRGQFGAATSLSVNLFHSQYRRLRSLDQLSNGTFVLGNQISGHVNGLEAWGSHQATKFWRLSAGVTMLNEHFSGRNLSQSRPGNDPHMQWRVSSSLDLAPGHELDLSLRRVGSLPAPTVPAYTTIDARYGWHITPTLEVSLTGQNLLAPRHQEFTSQASDVLPGNAIQIQRAVLLGLTARL